MSVLTWLQIVRDCTNVSADGVEVNLMAWPDGDSYLSQPSIAVSMIRLITDIMREEAAAKRGS